MVAVSYIDEGFISIASLMLGVGAIQKSLISMDLIGLARIITRTCIMAIVEFTSMAMELVLATYFLRDIKIRMIVIAFMSTVATLALGGVEAVLAKTPMKKSCVKVLIGGKVSLHIIA
ncbi:Vacuolar iron transporter-like 3 [Spatholobus suberectus]|nr:Vacuolar iron transporter-like 3 [Spatholobus suberectus]